MISLIIPTYRNPDYLDLCLRSAIEGQSGANEIIVVADGFIEESTEVLTKYTQDIYVLNLGHNQGMQTALNVGVMNANNETICIINDDNVLCNEWDNIISEDMAPNTVLTINQIEPRGPGIFNFPVKNFGTTPQDFNYEEFIKYESSIRSNRHTPDGGIFPFAMTKKDYMIVGGFETLYKSPFVCDWDFFLKLDLNNKAFVRTHKGHFYHFGSTATRKGGDAAMFNASEAPAAALYEYKWGFKPQLLTNNSHKPKGAVAIKGIYYD